MTNPALFHIPRQLSDLDCTTIAAQNMTLCSLASFKRDPLFTLVESSEYMDAHFLEIIFRAQVWSSGPFSCLFCVIEQPNSGTFVNTNSLDSNLESQIGAACGVGAKVERQLLSKYLTSNCVGSNLWNLKFETEISGIVNKWLSQETDEDPDFDDKRTEVNILIQTLQQQSQTVTLRPHFFLTMRPTNDIKGMKTLSPKNILKGKKKKLRM